MQCRSHVAQLGRLYGEFRAAGAEILVILGGTQEQARAYAESLKVPFPVLADPERQVYHCYGLERVLVLMQRTASIVVDREGVIRYMRRLTNPMPWLQESRQLREFVAGLGQGSAGASSSRTAP